MDSTNNVLTHDSRRNTPESSNSDPLEKAEEIVATATTTEPDLDAKADSEAHKAALITAIRNSGIPDLVWLWEFDPPPVSLRPTYPEAMRDNRLSTFVLPEQGWQIAAESLTRAEGIAMLDFVALVKNYEMTGEKSREESGHRLESVVKTFWALDLLGKRTSVKGNYAAVDMHWRSEINQLLSLIERARPMLSEEEEIDLCLVACLLRAQICPRPSHRSLAWGDLADALENIPAEVRQNRHDRQIQALHSLSRPSNRFYEQQERG